MEDAAGTQSARTPKFVSALILLSVLLYYLSGILFPDAMILRHRNDELHFHIPAIQKILDSGITDTLRTQPVASFPLFHMIVAPFYHLSAGNIQVLRLLSLLITFGTGFLIFSCFHRSDISFPSADRPLLAWAASLTFMLSPYVRASALSVTTDNLPFLFLFSGLAVMGVSRGKKRPVLLDFLVLFLGFLAFYSRQFYFWVPLFFLFEFLKKKEIGVGRKRALSGLFLVFTLPSICIFHVWQGPVPPAFQTHHSATAPLMAIPFIFSFIPLYFIPVYAAVAKERIRAVNWKGVLLFSVFASLFCLFYLQADFRLNAMDGGGITGLLISTHFHTSASFLFLVFGAVGLATILFRFVKAPGKNYVWILALAGFLISRVFWQRYFDPLVPMLIFLTMSQSRRVEMTRSKLILLFPLTEILIFAGVSVISALNIGLP